MTKAPDMDKRRALNKKIMIGFGVPTALLFFIGAVSQCGSSDKPAAPTSSSTSTAAKPSVDPVALRGQFHDAARRNGINLDTPNMVEVIDMVGDSYCKYRKDGKNTIEAEMQVQSDFSLHSEDVAAIAPAADSTLCP